MQLRRRLILKRRMALQILPWLFLSGCINGQGALYNPFGTNEYGVPHDRMPPPGLCRIWYPNRPAGHQPPAGDCDYLAARLPSDAKLIRGSASAGSFANPPSPPMSGSISPSSGSPSSGQPSYGIPPTGDMAQPPAPGSAEDMRSRQMEDLNRRY